MMKLTKPIAVRLLIAAACVAATQAAVWQIKHQSGLLAAQAVDFDVEKLPLQLGPWVGRNTEVPDYLLEGASAQRMVNRSYEGDRGRRAAVHLASYAPQVLDVPHPPHLPANCAIVAGWTVLSDDWRINDHNCRYRFMLTERQGARSASAYWYQFGPDVVSDRDGIRKVMQKLRLEGKPMPPMVKVLIQVPVDFSDADARSIAEDLGARIYDWVLGNS
jgi:hypothetical protein